MTESSELIETLRQAQRFGFFGDRPIEDAIEHSRQFVAAIRRHGSDRGPASLLDLGSGGGLPGLVLADAFPDARIVLLDRREKRTDFLRRAVARLGFDQVIVWSGDASEVVAAVEAGDEPGFEIVTARGFGPPDVTLTTAVSCLWPGGLVVISEPPSGDRWSPALLEALGVASRAVGGVRIFRSLPH